MTLSTESHFQSHLFTWTSYFFLSTQVLLFFSFHRKQLRTWLNHLVTEALLSKWDQPLFFCFLSQSRLLPESWSVSLLIVHHIPVITLQVQMNLAKLFASEFNQDFSVQNWWSILFSSGPAFFWCNPETRAGCFCDPGFIKNYDDKKCIAEKDCVWN